MGCMVDQHSYSAWMPWIGLYIAAASIACSVAMMVDYVQGFRHRKIWFPCKLFSLNATSLSLLAIATTLPGDLSTPMSSAQEQFAKLSGTSLICVAMGHFMPSIGAMEDSEVILNLIPLVILVITVIVSICIQVGAGVIYAFIPELIITLCFMLFMLLISCSSAVAIPTMKGLLKQQLELNWQKMQQQRQLNEPAMSTVESLKKDIKKYWTMALTSNPQYVLSRSSLGFAAGVVCVFQALVLIEALVRMQKRAAVPVCTNQSSSDYKWSIPFIVFSQLFTVVVGAVTPVVRASFGQPKNSFSTGIRESQGQQSAEREEQAVRNHQNKFELERYWIQKFVEWKDRPLLVFEIRNRCCQRLIHGSKNLIFEAMRWIHIGVVLLSKCVDFRSMYDHKGSRPKGFEVIGKMRARASSATQALLLSTMRAPQSAATKMELRPFVLHLENEGRLVDQIMDACDLNVDRWIQEGSCKLLANLTELLEKASNDHPGFVGEAQFLTAKRVQKPSNCWALPLVTLTSIALAIPCAQGDRIKQQLREGLSEGLKYVRQVDKSLDSQGGQAKVREAADVVWQGVHLHNQWIDVDLAAFATERGAPKNVIERLANKGSSYEAEVESLVKGMGDMKSGLGWPPRALALYSMANICKSILTTHSNFNIDDADALFKQLHVVISDMLGACLADLPRALYLQCHNSSMEAMDDRVMDAACLLGEAENILKALPTGGLEVNEGKYAERWRSFMPNWSDLPCISPVNASNTVV
ncbi:hypothetical protein ACLOJK_038938 [Asimina triloba]